MLSGKLFGISITLVVVGYYLDNWVKTIFKSKLNLFRFVKNFENDIPETIMKIYNEGLDITSSLFVASIGFSFMTFFFDQNPLILELTVNQLLMELTVFFGFISYLIPILFLVVKTFIIDGLMEIVTSLQNKKRNK